MLLYAAAASSGHEGTVQLLLKGGADVNARTKGGRSALHYTASKGHIRVAKVLIEAGSTSPSLADVSVGAHAVKCMLLYLHASACAGADVEAADATATTPLHRACSACKEWMVEVLIEAGASLVAADVNGDTALHVAGV